jgi:cytochrome c biogenesis protein CcmG/thiol:disulfide interchange protein DsbE
MSRYTPLVVLLLLAALLALPLLKSEGPPVSPLIGKAAPPAGLPEGAFNHGPALVNVFAAWCGPCADDQAALAAIGRAEAVPVYGIDTKDGRRALEEFLAAHGNPYAAIAVDAMGHAAVDWGVTDVPETFIVDRGGIVRYRHAGPVTMDVYKNEIRPLLAELKK